MEKFEGTETDITIKNHHKRGCPVYILDAILQGSISGLHKWEPLSLAGIYFVYSLFYAGSVALVINPSTGHVSLKFHVVFDDEFSTVPFMREGAILPNLKDPVQLRSHSTAPENIHLKNNWFNTYLGQDTSETLSH